MTNAKDVFVHVEAAFSYTQDASSIRSLPAGWSGFIPAAAARQLKKEGRGKVASKVPASADEDADEDAGATADPDAAAGAADDDDKDADRLPLGDEACDETGDARTDPDVGP